jgi:hypothetical protein
MRARSSRGATASAAHTAAEVHARESRSATAVLASQCDDAGAMCTARGDPSRGAHHMSRRSLSSCHREILRRLPRASYSDKLRKQFSWLSVPLVRQAYPSGQESPLVSVNIGRVKQRAEGDRQLVALHARTRSCRHARVWRPDEPRKLAPSGPRGPRQGWSCWTWGRQTKGQCITHFRHDEQSEAMTGALATAPFPTARREGCGAKCGL